MDLSLGLRGGGRTRLYSRIEDSISGRSGSESASTGSMQSILGEEAMGVGGRA